MARYRATLAYDGTVYHGFQRQAGDTPTIQRAVEVALFTVTGQEATVHGAGRTDSGVHARGQVIAFDVDWGHPDEALLRALNINLPRDIALQGIAQQPGFHPRFDALARIYSYTIVVAPQRQPLMRRFAWHLYGTIDFDAMEAAAQMLVGEHDFATFGRPTQGDVTIRRVFAAGWSRQQERNGLRLCFRVEANGFLHRMVRRMVGMQADVGLGRRSLADFEAAFNAADLSLARTVAPPQGLVFEAVRYC